MDRRGWGDGVGGRVRGSEGRAYAVGADECLPAVADATSSVGLDGARCRAMGRL